MIEYADFLECSVPTPFRILGLNLLPFSLGKLNLLDKFSSPFLRDLGPVASRQELQLALMVCALPYRDGYELFRSPAMLDKQIKRWSQRVGRRLFLFSRTLPWEEARQLFGQYLDMGMLTPKVWSYEGDAVELGAPWQITLKTVLMRNRSEEEVLDMYLPLAWLEYHAIMERESKRKILFSDHDIALLAAARELEQRMKHAPVRN